MTTQRAPDTWLRHLQFPARAMCWLLRAPEKFSRTRSTVSADGPGWHVRFAAHRQPLCLNFLHHSRIVLSICRSAWYLVRNPFAPSKLILFWQIQKHRTLSYPLSSPYFVTTAL
jgi:hypothetical protein